MKGKTQKQELKVSETKDPMTPLLRGQIISFISGQQCEDRKQENFQSDTVYWAK